MRTRERAPAHYGKVLKTLFCKMAAIAILKDNKFSNTGTTQAIIMHNMSDSTINLPYFNISYSTNLKKNP